MTSHLMFPDNPLEDPDEDAPDDRLPDHHRIFGKKDDYEKEDEEVERLLDESPEDKPPRDDRSRDHIDTGDPDIDEDPDTSDDPDMSMNYKDIGGRVAQKWASDHPHPAQNPYPIVGDPRDMSDEQLGEIVAEAADWMDKAALEEMSEDMTERVALDYAIYTIHGGRFFRAVDSPTYQALLEAFREYRQ